MVRADLAAHAAPLLDPGWLASQRWYGANDRRLASVTLNDAAPLPLAGGANAWLLVASAAFAEGPPRRYLIPAVEGEGRTLREPRDGEGAWSALAAAIAEHRVLPGETATFRCEPAPALEELLTGGAAAAAGLAESRLGVEQTNTSVRLGDRLILKLYRGLEPGENPELEVGAFLASVGCRVVPRIAGWIRFLGEVPSAAAMLQERVASTGDAWGQFTDLLAAGRAGEDDAVAAAARIGSVTAQLHTALAARPLDVAFPVRPATAAEVRTWRSLAERMADRASSALAGSPHANALDELLPAVRDRLDAAFLALERPRVQRIHGDYHLGQLLHTADSYVVIDFEGEPARPLEERRAPAPAERDLAGMLRSFDYAARKVAHETGGAFLADAWVARARAAFLDAYRAGAPSPPDPNLLAIFELEKACYEVVYEASNRPEWVWLPLEALRRIGEGSTTVR